ncbi:MULTISPECIES: MarR family transcriptional regulator [Janibacter]|uniref:MarR family winged helix-turn-helix transcriptional regulator n=1 Tax=Janibacter TaxID=53457 RepID=UPI00177F9AA6|nr:MarR family transcriptional regulator [Janibacter melonis]MBD5830104.1 MarR family transcriptional regulator [Janibacter melonis]
MSPARDPWLRHDEQLAWRAYLRGSRLLEEALDDDLGGTCQLTEYELISMLSEAPGRRMRMSELADTIIQSRSRVTHTAGRLERRGWVRRERSHDDGRGVDIMLTDAGMRALLELAPRHAASVRARLVDVLDHEQLMVLGEAMAAIRDHLAPDHHEIGIDD